MGLFSRFSNLERAKQIALETVRDAVTDYDDAMRKGGFSEDDLRSLRRLTDGRETYAGVATVKIMNELGISRDEAGRIASETVAQFLSEHYRD